MKNFKVECLDVKMNYKIIGSQIDDFGKDIEKKMERQCYQSDRKNVIQTKRKDDCPPTDCKTTWGNWIKTEVDPNPPETREQCIQKDEKGTRSIRFCRQNDCLFMEVEHLTWKGAKSCTTCTCTAQLPESSVGTPGIPFNPATREPAYEECT